MKRAQTTHVRKGHQTISSEEYFNYFNHSGCYCTIVSVAHGSSDQDFWGGCWEQEQLISITTSHLFEAFDE